MVAAALLVAEAAADDEDDAVTVAVEDMRSVAFRNCEALVVDVPRSPSR